MQKRVYHYVGPKELLSLVLQDSKRIKVVSKEGILRFHREQKIKGSESTATYIVDKTGRLWIASRYSEHVACANGEAVQAAGEISFFCSDKEAKITSITNQSTGYCPEPESFTAVASSLRLANLPSPEKFSHAFLFRWCEPCHMTNLIKNEIFACSICGQNLSETWNYQALQSRYT